MRIQNLPSNRPNQFPVRSQDEKSPDPGQQPKDSWSPDTGRVGAGAFIVGASVVPLLGAATNLMAAWATAWDDSDSHGSGIRPAIGLGGALANVAGTAVGTYGLLSGNHTARMAGLALLGTSGVAAGALVLGSK